jgi:protein involved in polysaccharide export with SLBB domain
VTKAMARGSFGSGQRYKPDKFCAMAVSIGLTIFIAAAQGCSTTPQAGPGAGAVQRAETLTPAATTTSSDQQVKVGHSGRLAELSAERSKDSFSPDFAVGPGDILEISVPDMEQLKDREARVSASGTITLPVVGVVDVGGMTQDQLKVALEKRLARYMRDPDVDVSVKEYHSREVAVVGMVQKPGLYTLETRSDTILDMISKAGGMTENASSRIIFVPAPKNGNLALQRRLVASAASDTPKDSPPGSARQIAAGAVRPVSVDGAEQPSEKAQANHNPSTPGLYGVGQIPAALQQANPIQIDLSSSRNSKEFVDLPARPGDVIIVPASGEVMVQGWVASPGAFKITPGMTALGAVTAAGGEQFSSSATVLRNGDDGDKVQIPINLSRIKAGEERDVAVQSGDVVIVNRSAVGAVPYLVYSLFNKFGTGAFIPLPAL